MYEGHPVKIFPSYTNFASLFNKFKKKILTKMLESKE